MGRFKRNIGALINGIAYDSRYNIETQKGYKHKSSRFLLAKIGAAIVTLAIPLFTSIMQPKETTYVSLLEAQKISIEHTQENKTQATPTFTGTQEQKLSKQKINEPQNKIYAERLQNNNTVFENSTVLRYTKNGIHAQADDCVVTKDTPYFPNQNGFIEIPEKLIGKKLRFAKINPQERDNPEPRKRYYASFETHAERETPKETRYATLEKTIENITLKKQTKTLEQTVHFEMPSYTQKNCVYNSNGNLRSDRKTISSLIYEGKKTFDERAKELKLAQYSNKDIARLMSEETTKYFGGTKMNINTKQISDALARQDWVSVQAYERKRDLPSKAAVTLYGRKAIRRSIKKA